MKEEYPDRSGCLPLIIVIVAFIVLAAIKLFT